MRIGIIGAGISGLGAAWALHRDHDITVFEANDYVGGHSNTVEVPCDAGGIAVDTGFIVYNDATYPNLIRLFDTLDVPTARSDMSFSVTVDGGRFEYAGSALGLVAQPSNLARPRYWRMLRDLLRFYREAPSFLASVNADQVSLGDYLDWHGYSDAFVEDHLLPMGAAIWSSSLDDIRAFPASTFIRFCVNHGLLKLVDRPAWRTVRGGSREYVRRLTAGFRDRIRTNARVAEVRRTGAGVLVCTADGSEDRFDELVLATHGDQALRILGAGASEEERRVLGAFRYSRNRALLHRDPALMPRRRATWSSWNYLAAGDRGAEREVAVTYWMNKLQNIDRAMPLFVTLNPIREPAGGTVLGEFTYDHPQFDRAAIAAQRLLADIQGVHRTWFCGSYCGYGFHEDGLQAGLAVAGALGSPAPWADDVVPMSPAADAVVAPAVLAAAE